MERLTHKRKSGMKTGYWSPNKKQELVDRLAMYDEGGTFYPGDDEKSYSSYGIFVNAWMPLPEPYREEQ